MEPGSYYVYKSDANGNVRGHKLTSEQLKGVVGVMLQRYIESQTADAGRVEIVPGQWFVWFPASGSSN